MVASVGQMVVVARVGVETAIAGVEATSVEVVAMVARAVRLEAVGVGVEAAKNDKQREVPVARRAVCRRQRPSCRGGGRRC